MKKLLSVMAVLLMAGVLAFPPAAQATVVTPILYLDDNAGNTLTIPDGTALDSNPLAGWVTYLGALGPTWFANVTTGVSYSPDTTPYALDLNSIDRSNGAGTLTIAFSDIGFGGGTLAAMEIGGTTQGSVTYSAYYDNTFPNVSDIPPTGTATLIHTIGPLGPGSFEETWVGSTDVGSPSTLMGVFEISHGAAGLTSFNGNLAVPLPPTALLLGGGLLGLVALGWRRRRS